MRTRLYILIVGAVAACAFLAIAKDDDSIAVVEDQRDPIDADLPVAVHVPVSSESDLVQTTNKLREAIGNGRWTAVSVRKVETRGATNTEVTRKSKGTVATPRPQEQAPSKVSIVLEILERREVVPGEAYRHAAVKGMVATNKSEFMALRAMWEPRFVGRNYEVRAHWHHHALTEAEQTPCQVFVVRDTNGVENAKALDEAFKYDGRRAKK